MSKHARDRRPYIPSVKRIELSQQHIKPRLIAIVVLLALAVTALTVGLTTALKTEPGWQKVEVSPAKINCSEDFVLMYEFGAGEQSASAEYKEVASLYSGLTEQGYQLFSAQEGGSVQPLNAHPNEAVTVPEELYASLAMVAEASCRYPFLAPVVQEYNGVFLAEDDMDAALVDPNRDPERMGYALETAAFAADPAHISLELLGDNRVKLVVSEEYLAYGQQNDIESYFDFGWMKNAFLTDYLARNLEAAGYTRGYLASFDGFTRNLDSRGEAYSYNLFDRWENTISIPARLQYDMPMSIVTLRNYPLSDSDRWHYRAYADGGITSVYLDTRGYGISSTDNLTVYSAAHSCAELLLQAASVFLAEELDFTAIGAMEAAGIHSVFAEGKILTATQSGDAVELLPEGSAEGYQLEILK